MRRRLAFLICSSLKDEVHALQSGNTKAVLLNDELFDRVQALRIELKSFLFDRRVPVSIRESAAATLVSSQVYSPIENAGE